MFLQLLHLGQAGLAGYGAQQSYIAITNLQTYEETSEKLAKFSNEAERQLHKTRTTQTSGALAIAASLLAALYLFFKGGSSGALFRLIASPVMGAGIFFARSHIQGFWAGGKRVPLPKMEDYNEAQQRTEELLKVLDWLVLSWVATSLVAVFKGY